MIWLWLVLLAALGLPAPFPGMLAERGAPITYLCVAALAVLVVKLWASSRAAAAFVGYVFLNSLVDILFIYEGPKGWGVRPVVMLLLLVVGVLLYLAVLEGFARQAWVAQRIRVLAAVFLAVAGLQGLLVVLNRWEIYPSLLFWQEARLVAHYLTHGLSLEGFRVTLEPALAPGFSGQAAGWLTHPNYVGSLLALATPVALVVLGPLGAVLGLCLVLATFSIGPMISALAGLSLFLPRRQWVCALAAALVLVGGVAVVHYRAAGIEVWDLEHLTSGRSTVVARGYQATSGSVPHILFGRGWGFWRIWADVSNQEATQARQRVRLGAPAASASPRWLASPAVEPGVVVTRQAHMEPLQILFELGVVGLGLFLGVLAEVGVRIWRCWRLWRRWERLWAAVLLVGLVNSLGSPTFHLPWQAGICLFAYAMVQWQYRAALAACRVFKVSLLDRPDVRTLLLERAL